MLARQSLARVCPCTGGRCLAASFSGVREVGSSAVGRRDYSTASKSDSIFSGTSHWDSIFEDIKDVPISQPLPTVNPRSLKSATLGRAHPQNPRPVSMTRRESTVFTAMFDTIFQANSVSGATGGIGQLPGNSPVASHLSAARHARWTSEADAELDRKKEEMALCETDLQLLEWAMREVFGESERYVEAAAARASSALPAKKSSGNVPADFTLPLQPTSYPHLLAALMRTFRDKYRDPHLALAMFDHARNLSIASFVFGCTTPAYNELIETRWRSFRDLRGVADALDEMRVNGIPMDGRTRLLAETVRREVGERTLWQEESSLGSGEVWALVARIERLTIAPAKRAPSAAIKATAEQPPKPKWVSADQHRRWSARQEMWKRNALDADARDSWSFDRWVATPKKASSPRKQPLLL